MCQRILPSSLTHHAFGQSEIATTTVAGSVAVALVGRLCRLWQIILTPGNGAGCTVGRESLIGGVTRLLGAKALDSFRKSLRHGRNPRSRVEANRKKRIRDWEEAVLSQARALATCCDQLTIASVYLVARSGLLNVCKLIRDPNE
jgi:hypothetical protein